MLSLKHRKLPAAGQAQLQAAIICLVSRGIMQHAQRDARMLPERHALGAALPMIVVTRAPECCCT